MKVTQALQRILMGIAATLLAATTACDTEDVQLEPVFAKVVQGDAATPSALACVTVYVSTSADPAEAIYEIYLNGAPLTSTYGVKITVGSSAANGYCVDPGSYNISLRRKGHIVGATGTIVAAPGDALALLAYGAPDTPTVRWFATVDSDPGLALKHARFSNLDLGQQPAEIIYLDALHREVARSPLVAYGDTWSGLIPDTVTSYTFPGEFPGSDPPGSYPFTCDFEHTQGVVLLSHHALIGNQTYAVMPEFAGLTRGCPR
ncbi:MAG: hypothetical protein RLZZ450_6351 [Pseudomonadota bacterium]|jgi:hypothetical protein